MRYEIIDAGDHWEIRCGRHTLTAADGARRRFPNYWEASKVANRLASLESTYPNLAHIPEPFLPD
jgi:hypothetical protein